jgi:hypothetical protein
MALLTRALTSEERADMAGIVPIDGGGYVLIAQVVDEDLEIWSADDSLETREQLKNWLVSLLPGLICCPLSDESLSLAGIYPGSLPAAELEARLQALLRDMARGFPVHVLIALSDQMQSISGDAEHAYKQARFALSFRFFNPEGGLIPYHTVAPLRSRELPYLFRYEQMLLQKLTDATEEGLDGLLDEMFTYLNAQMRYAPEKLLRRLYQVSQSMISGIESRLPEMAFAHLWANAAGVTAGPCVETSPPKRYGSV